MCVDDTQIFASFHDANELIVKLNSDLAQVRKWLIKNKLQMYPSKSRLLFIESSYNLNYNITEQPVVVNDQPISRTSAHKCLGVHIDEKLSWDYHVDTICKKVSAGIGAMRSIKNFVPVATLGTVHKGYGQWFSLKGLGAIPVINGFYGLVQPYFEYYSPLRDTCSKLLKDKLE